MTFSVDLEGKVKNTNLPKSKPLLPIFEAIINSIHAIEESCRSNGEVTIKILRDSKIQLDLLSDDGFARITGFEIIDNGIGFNDDNYQSFLTSDTTYKKHKGSKGVGRFTWLKAFLNVEINSIYLVEEKKYQRKFYFSLKGVNQSTKTEIENDSDCKTIIRLLDIRHPYSTDIPQKKETIARYILEHCLSYFLLGSLPNIKIVDQVNAKGVSEQINLNDYFTECTKNSLHKFDRSIKDYDFVIQTLRFYKGQNNDHTVSYCANYREVISETVAAKYNKDLEQGKKIRDVEDQPFVYFICVSSPYLDDHVDPSRTMLNIDEQPSELSDMMGDITMSEIREEISDIIEQDLKDILERIRTKKEGRIREFVRSKAPGYRPLIKYRPDLVFSLSPSINEQQLEIELHRLMGQYEVELKQQGSEILKTPMEHFREYPDYAEKYHYFLEQYNDVGKSKLANYVVHRRIMLELFEKGLQKKDDERYFLERDIHEIIHPMQTTSDDINYIQHNLWIIDERLSYHSMLASDKKLSDLEDSDISSDKRPDILIFNNPIAFIEDADQPYSSIVIIEFKRPMRKGYSEEENPFTQVYDYVRKIKSGKFTDKNGLLVNLRPNTPFYIYIICDLTPSLKKFAENNSCQETPDGQGYYTFNQNFNAYIEVISFPKLLGDAKKRNKILFDTLSI